MAYTTIDDPSAHFHIQLYTGTGANQVITNDANAGNFQPDFVAIKNRGNGSYGTVWFDSSRGVYRTLYSDQTYGSDAEFVDSGESSIQSFNTNGFTGGSSTNPFLTNWTNSSGESYVALQWKANGGTTSSNTDGTLTSTVQANTDAGFSIVTYSNPSTSDNTIGHGLGVQPEVIIFKNRVDVIDWYVASKYLSNYTTAYLKLNSDDAEATSADGMNSTAPTSSVFSVGGISRTGDNGNGVVAYCFASKQGYSKFGKYVGNGSLTSGPFVYTGFKPAFVMIKATDAVKNWIVFDNKRLGYNGGMYFFYANLTNAEGESPSSGAHIDLLSNGFKIYDNFNLTNQNTVNYIYMAFAENPFVSSTGIPTTAR